MMDRFWDAWEKSTVVSGVLALGLMGCVGFLAVQGRPIPEGLSIPFGVVIGYFFAAKQQQVVKTATRVMHEHKEG